MGQAKIKILFDHQIFSLQKVGGISRYYAELIKNLPQYNCDTVIPDFYSDNIYLKNNKDMGLSFIPPKIRGRLNELLSRKNSKELLRDGDYDVFHPTYYSIYHLGKSKKPFVITVHDMIHEIYPHQYRNPGEIQKNKKKLIQEADKIIAISEHTKSDILKYNDVNPSKIEVIYHGTSILNLTPEPIPSLLNRFVLFVGERKGYKNFKTLVEAFSKANLPHDVTLFSVGGGPFNEDEMKFLEELKIEKRTIQKSLTDSELAWAYKNAACFVFPSLYEGFGIPILESMSFGTPTILSETSCFPEIAGDAAIYFKTTDELASAIGSVLNSEISLESLKEKALAQSRLYSWDKVAKQTSDVYRSLI
jgi:glycosyltransferase involved in cell wall biosynthesis